jgi:archaellum component FlaC
LDITSLEAAMSNQPSETVDLSERVAALEQRVTRVEAMTEVVTAIRADVATIAEGVDPNLAGHVAELADTVENHGLLLARLLDNE